MLPRCCGTAVGHKDETTDAGGVVHTLLIDNYDSYTYNLFQQLAVINGRAPYVVYNDDDGGDLWCVGLFRGFTALMRLLYSSTRLTDIKRAYDGVLLLVCTYRYLYTVVSANVT